MLFQTTTSLARPATFAWPAIAPRAFSIASCNVAIDTVPVRNECSRDAERETWVSVCKRIPGTPKSRQRSNLLTRRNPRDSNVLLQPNQWRSELTVEVITARVSWGGAQVLKDGEMGSAKNVGGGGGSARLSRGEAGRPLPNGYMAKMNDAEHDD
jgi:hypothetical protein